MFNLPQAPRRSRPKPQGRATEAKHAFADDDLVEDAIPAAAGSCSALSFQEQTWSSETKTSTLDFGFKQQPHFKRNLSKKTHSVPQLPFPNF
jgi:hypothetical protein